MDFPQTLYSQRIYRINKLIGHLKEAFGLDNYFVGFDTLNYYTLKFNWYAINSARWHFDQETVQNIKACYNRHENEWKAFFSKLEVLNQVALNQSIREFQIEIKKDEPDEKCTHYHLTNMYQSYPIDSDKFLDGIIYNNCKKENKRLKYAKGTFLADEDTYIIYPPISFEFLFWDGCTIKCHSETCPQENPNDGSESGPYESEDIYFHYIVPLLVGFADPKNGGLFNGKIGNTSGGDEDKYLFSTDEIKNGISGMKSILCIPVYDAVIGNNTCGNLYGNLSIAFEEKDILDSFVTEKETKFDEIALYLSMGKIDPTLR